MKNKNLLAILESLPDDAEISVTVKDAATGNIRTETYDIGYRVSESGKLELQIAV